MNGEDTTEEQNNVILTAIAELSRKIDNHKQATDIQLEAIRSGLAANHAAFDRLQARVLNLGADISELTEELRRRELV